LLIDFIGFSPVATVKGRNVIEHRVNDVYCFVVLLL
jgi:hypothetical protein